MHGYSLAATRFLAAKTLDAISRILNGTNYLQLRGMLYPQPHYASFLISKRDGTTRQIDAPRRRIKDVQRRLAAILVEVYGPGRPSVHGFQLERSVFTNATPHARVKTFVLNLDLQDFFPSIHYGRVRGLFANAPFNFAAPIASVLAHICCYRGKLPQGAPTSPVISNLICRSLDYELERLAKSCRATYTRYCDDITFSFTVKTLEQLPQSIVQTPSVPIELGASLRGVIAKHSFQINDRKIRLRGRHHRQEVTGLTVNDFVNVRRTFVHEIRGMLHAWEKYGLDLAQAELANHYRKQLATRNIPRFDRVLRGKLLYVRMVRRAYDQIYAKLADRFNTLLLSSKVADTPPLKVTRRVTAIGDLSRAVFVLECHMFDVTYRYIQGTAFYVDGVGFVTCEHVLRRDDSTPPNYVNPHVGDVVKVLDEAGTFEIEVEVAATFLTEDVAILRPLTPLPPSVIPLALGESEPTTGDLVTLAGFPAYSPGKSISTITATSINRYPKFGKRHFEIDQLIRKGNSGGPVLDKRFFVVGVAKEGATQEEGNNAVLSVAEVRTVLGL
jgi:RNA-directed DNA polymerase